MHHLKAVKEEVDPNQIEVSTSDFLSAYNVSIPEAFPRANVRVLEVFQETYPSLFSKKKLWTIDKHRKKVMDWLASYSAKV